VARDYHDLVVWQLADELRREVYRLTDSGSVLRDFKFRAQLRDAASGIPSNVAEGFRRVSAREFARFLRYSFSGLGETVERLQDGVLRRHWDQAALRASMRLIKRLDAGLVELIRYLQTPAALARSQAILDGQSTFVRTPVEPAEPAEPAEPVEPAEPAEPVEPAEPAEPREPVEPR
jgi:four helix bundle protein